MKDDGDRLAMVYHNEEAKDDINPFTAMMSFENDP